MITFKIILVLFLSTILVLFNYNRKRTNTLYKIVIRLTPKMREYFFKVGNFIVTLKEKIKKSDNARKFFIRMIIAVLFILQIAAYFAGLTADEHKQDFIDLLLNKSMTLEQIEYEYKTFHVNFWTLFCTEIFMISLFNYNFADKIFLMLTKEKLRMFCFALLGFFFIFYSPENSIAYETAVVMLFASEFYSNKISNHPPIGIKPIPSEKIKTDKIAA